MSCQVSHWYDNPDMQTLPRTRSLGTVRYGDLVASVAEHVAIALGEDLNRRRHVTDAEDPRYVTLLAVQQALSAVNPDLEIVAIDPKRLKTCSRKIANEAVPFMKAWKQGFRFPPIIIDSGARGVFLHDGRHRSCSAARLGIPEIEAIDLKDVDLGPLERWFKAQEA